MPSSVSICSNALIRLGDKAIASFSEPTKRATACSNLYPDVRDALLRAHPWNCAKKRLMLAPLADAPAFGWRYQFQLPSDWMRNIQVGADNCQIDFAMEGRNLLANVDALPLVYVFRNTVESTWDGALIDTMTAAMTAALAWPITQSAALTSAMEQKFQMQFKVAKSVNGQDEPDQTLGDFPLLASRVSSYSRAPGR